MTKRKNEAASVKQRLLNLAKERGEDFNLILNRYGIERMLYRLAASEHASDFILKGAMLFNLWIDAPHRPTRDVDLLGRGSPDLDRLAEVFRSVCGQPVDDDGVIFDPSTVEARRIRDDAEYEGVRVLLEVRLGSARNRLQIDVGLGDAVVPAPEEIEYPVLLDHPAPRIRAYRRETVVAEKLQAMVELGMANSRMKDFFDVRFLAQNFDFDGAELAQAIAATFQRRKTEMPEDLPTALSDEFAEDARNQTQWKAFLRRTGLTAALDFGEVVADLRSFLMPPIDGLREDGDFDEGWRSGGPWR